MEGPKQLSLPLFDTAEEQPRRVRRRPSARVTDEKRAVVASRSLAHADAAHGQQRRREAAVAGLLTTAEAAAVLHVHPRTVQRLVERSQLEAIHLGAAVRFDPQDVADLTTRLKRPAPSAPRPTADVLRPSRPVRISFADRLRSQRA